MEEKQSLSTTDAARLFAALSDPTRLRLLELLSRQIPNSALCVTALAQCLDVSQPAVSQHLRVLRNAGLLKAEKRGPRTHYFIDTKALENLRRLADRALSLDPREGCPCREKCR